MFGITQLDECGVCDGDNTSVMCLLLSFEIELDEDQLSSFMLPITDQNRSNFSRNYLFSSIW